MTTVDTSTGIVKATVLAGPIFLVALAGLPVVTGHAPVHLRPDMVLAPVLLALAVIPGAVLAIGPVLAGTAVMAALGRGNVGLRHPAAWALAGGGAVVAIAAWLGAARTEDIAPFVATGAACAILARSGVRWTD